MPDKKATMPPPQPTPAPADAPRHRPPESPDFAAPPDSLPEAALQYDEDPFDTPDYEPPLKGEGP